MTSTAGADCLIHGLQPRLRPPTTTSGDLHELLTTDASSSPFPLSTPSLLSFHLSLFSPSRSSSRSPSMGHRRGGKAPAWAMYTWVRGQSMKAKMALGALAAVLCLAALWILVRDHNHFFVASEAVHAAGIIVLIYKLTRQKTCSGLPLKFQELTAIFMTMRLYCSVIIKRDIHTVLDLLTLLSTLWVIYMMRFKLNSSYTKELDNMPRYYLLIPSVVLAIFVHPFMYTHHARFLWAFTVYLESLSALPQLRLMQKN